MGRPPYSRKLGTASGGGVGLAEIVAEVPAGFVYVVTWISLSPQSFGCWVTADVNINGFDPVMGLASPFNPWAGMQTLTQDTRAVLVAGDGLFANMQAEGSTAWIITAYGFVLTDDGP